APVIPARFVVLAIRVVVAALGATKFIAAEKHRHAAGDELGQHEVPDLPFAQRLDFAIVAWTLDAVIVAEIVVAAVAVPLSIRLVVLAAITDEVVEGESVVTGHEIDAALGPLSGPAIDVGAAADAARDRTDHAVVAAPEAADIVPIAAVPLRPLGLKKAAHLIGACYAPRFGDQLGPSQNGIFRDALDQRRIAQKIAIAVATEYRREVEAEP